ncbi:MAG: hypothetical protein ABIN67_13850 [Ferruginibacter sp.]
MSREDKEARLKELAARLEALKKAERQITKEVRNLVLDLQKY